MNKQYIIVISICLLLLISYQIFKNEEEPFQDNDMYKINKINTEIIIDDNQSIKDKYIKIATIKKSPKNITIELSPSSKTVTTFLTFNIATNADNTINVKTVVTTLKNNDSGMFVDKNIYAEDKGDNFELYIKIIKEIKKIKVSYSQENLEITDTLLHGNLSQKDISQEEPTYNVANTSENIPTKNPITMSEIANQIIDDSNATQIELNEGIDLGTKIQIGKKSVIDASNGNLRLGSSNCHTEINDNGYIFKFPNGSGIGIDKWKIIHKNGNRLVFENNRSGLVIYFNNYKLGLITSNNVVGGFNNRGINLNHINYFGRGGHYKIKNSPWGSKRGYWKNKDTNVKIGYFEDRGRAFAYSTDGLPLMFRKCCVPANSSRASNDKYLRGYIFNHEGFSDYLENYDNSEYLKIDTVPLMSSIKQHDFNSDDSVLICDMSNATGDFIVNINIVSFHAILQDIIIVKTLDGIVVSISNNKVGDNDCFEKVYYHENKLYGIVTTAGKYMFSMSSRNNNVILGDVMTTQFDISNKQETLKNNTLYISSDSRDELNINETEYIKKLVKELNKYVGANATISKFNETGVVPKSSITLVHPVKIPNSFKTGNYVFRLQENGNLEISKAGNKHTIICNKQGYVHYDSNGTQKITMKTDGKTDVNIENEMNNISMALKFNTKAHTVLRISERGGVKLSNSSQNKGLHIPFGLNVNNQMTGGHQIDGFAMDLQTKSYTKSISKNGNYIIAEIFVGTQLKYIKFIVDNCESYLLINNGKHYFISNAKIGENNIIAHINNNLVTISIIVRKPSKINYETVNLENKDFVEHQMNDTNNKVFGGSKGKLARSIYYRKENTNDVILRNKIINKYTNMVSSIDLNKNVKNIRFEGGITLYRGKYSYNIEESNGKFVIYDQNSNNNFIEIDDNNINFNKPNGVMFGKFMMKTSNNQFSIVNSKRINLLSFSSSRSNTMIGIPKSLGTSHISGLYGWNRVNRF